VKREVLIPAFMPGIEETHNLASKGIYASKVGAFVEVTAVTGQREISHVIAPPVLFRDDMLDMVS
jgi:hypothetical protein